MESLQTHMKSYFDKLLQAHLPQLPINFNKANPPLVYGAGVVGQAIISGLQLKAGIKVKWIIDKNKELWGKKLEQAVIISPDEGRRKYLNSPIIVASVIYETEIVKFLKEAGFTQIYPLTYLNYLDSQLFDYRDYSEKYKALFKNNAQKKIIQVYNLLADKKSKIIFKKIIKFRLKHYYDIQMDLIMSKADQYFEAGVIKLRKNEVFVDGGAYDGDTVRRIRNNPEWKDWKIFAFEPDPANYDVLKKSIKDLNLSNVTAVKSGLWSKLDTLKFFGLGSPESGIGGDDKFKSWSGDVNSSSMKAKIVELSVVSLDKYFYEKEMPTYIKMDIEGAEKEALMGAKQMIREFKPKLAICVYHKPSDLWEIPLLIKKLNPDYKLYLRHYSRELCETVVYAV